MCIPMSGFVSANGCGKAALSYVKFGNLVRCATRNFRGQGSRRQKGHNKKFCVKGISLRLSSLDLETEEIFEAFS